MRVGQGARLVVSGDEGIHPRGVLLQREPVVRERPEAAQVVGLIREQGGD